jgi:UDP-N-acetylglucosamine--N-acetylmuramyl-(pentapeptide) pyrophosphoryl-undecaprenol N-acetylglucosamine transferase
MEAKTPTPSIVIACGGTGGHLFPGLAVAEELLLRRCQVTLMVSPKDVDQQAVKAVRGMDVVTLPAIGLQRGQYLKFFLKFWQSRKACVSRFRKQSPHAVLAMGGFTSVAPILAGRSFGAKTFLHDSNTIPGRANRWLAPKVNQAFTWFPQTEGHLKAPKVTSVGMPVRNQFEPLDAAACKTALGFNSQKPLLLIMGGSQGARGINELMRHTLPNLALMSPELQYMHLTGTDDFERVKSAYTACKVKALVRPFFSEMELAMGGASAAISRAGASSLAEIAAMRLPAVLIPFPQAADNHQYHNARAFLDSNAARMMEQKDGRPEALNLVLLDLIGNRSTREAIGFALGKWHTPQAAAEMAETILQSIRIGRGAVLSNETGVRATAAADAAVGR